MNKTFTIKDQNGRCLTLPFCARNQPISVLISAGNVELWVTLDGNAQQMLKYIKGALGI